MPNNKSNQEQRKKNFQKLKDGSKIKGAYGPDTHGTYGSYFDFRDRYYGWTFKEIMSEIGSATIAKGYRYDRGPKLRYIKNPYDGKFIDMTHFLYVGERGRLFGFAVESFQLVNGNSSAFKRQDLYSNALGRRFWKIYRKKIEKEPRKIVAFIGLFLIEQKGYNISKMNLQYEN